MPDKIQIETGDASGDIEAGLNLNAKRLQGNAFPEPPDKYVGAKSGHNGGFRGRSDIGALKRPALGPARREHRPGKDGLIGNPDIDPKLANPPFIAFDPPPARWLVDTIDLLRGDQDQAYATFDRAG